MYILGYSGLNDLWTFKQRSLTTLTEQENQFTQGMNSAAAIIQDGKIIAAAEEERFNGEKHTGQFPIQAIQFCLAQAGITLEEVKYICHGFNYAPYQNLFSHTEYGKACYRTALAPEVQQTHFQKFWPQFPIAERFIAVNHHSAHAASAFYPSGFQEALVLVADGMGEVDSISIFHGKDNQLLPLRNYDLFSSLGMLYTIVTHHLGFAAHSGEGKVMGLAPYGNPQRFAGFFTECIRLEPEGEIFINGFLHNNTALDRETYRGFRRWLAEKTIPPRTSEQPLTQDHQDLAAALQQALNQALLHLLTYWQQQTNLKQLCYAGGVALNCVANSAIMQSGLFNDIYVQPAAGDAGTALGAALYHYKHTLQLPGEDIPQQLPFYGPDVQVDTFLANCNPGILQQWGIAYQTASSDKILKLAVNLLTQGKLIAWVQGRMEFGPRALGHRSILADPRDPHIRDKVNYVVKKRENFRPFAPSVKHEKVHLFFDIPRGKSLPTMLFTAPVQEKYRQQLPAVIHVDHTARIQTVNKNDHPYYWRLLDKFEAKTGFPLILNTSFNSCGQPIVCTAKEAIETFAHLEIDALFVGNYVFYKAKNKTYAKI